MGRYKQWNGLLEWNTGLDYWTELVFFFGQVSEFIFGTLIFMIYTVPYGLKFLKVKNFEDFKYFVRP